ncbi:MAG: hypothetical protein ACKESB_02925 [Candidatus Hodgkinia cicadicola]
MHMCSEKIEWFTQAVLEVAAYFGYLWFGLRKANRAEGGRRVDGCGWWVWGVCRGRTLELKVWNNMPTSSGRKECTLCCCGLHR